MDAQKFQLLEEADRRGILPPEKKALFDEAKRRGLFGSNKENENSQTASEQGGSNVGALVSKAIPFAKSLGDTERGQAAVATTLQGATLGNASRLQGAFNAIGAKLFGGKETDNVPFSELYEKYRGREEKILEHAKEKYPIQSMATEIAGSIPIGGEILKGVEKSIPALKEAPQIVKTAVGSSVLGSITGASESKNLSEIPQKATEGAVFGTLLGTGLHLTGTVAKAGFTTAKRMLGINPSGEAYLATHIKPEEAKKAADELIKAQNEGRRILATETGGKKIQGVAKQIAGTNLEGAGILSEELAKRAEQSSEATQTILKGISDGSNYFKNLKDLAVDRKTAAAPFRQEGYKLGENLPTLYKGKTAIDESGIFGKPLNPKERLLASDFEDLRADRRFNEYAKDFEGQKPNSVQFLHEMRKNVDADITSVSKNLAGPSPTSAAQSELRGLKNFRNKLTNLMYKATGSEGKTIGALEQADKIYAGSHALERAQKAGAEFSGYKDNEEFKLAMQEFEKNPSELEAFKNGVAQNLRQAAINVVGDNPNPAKKIINSELNKEKLKLLFKDPKEYNQVIQKLEDEVNIVKTRAQILGKSPASLTPDDAMKFTEYATLNPIKGSMTLRVVDNISNYFRNKYNGLSNKNSVEIAKILVDPKKSIDALLKIAKTAEPSQKKQILTIVHDYLPVLTAAHLAGNIVRQNNHIISEANAGELEDAQKLKTEFQKQVPSASDNIDEQTKKRLYRGQ